MMWISQEEEVNPQMEARKRVELETASRAGSRQLCPCHLSSGLTIASSQSAEGMWIPKGHGVSISPPEMARPALDSFSTPPVNGLLSCPGVVGSLWGRVRLPQVSARPSLPPGACEIFTASQAGEVWGS